MDGHGRLLDFPSGHDLPSCKLMNSILLVSQPNLFDGVFSNVREPIKLCHFLFFQSVHCKVFIVNNYFFVKVVNFLLLSFLLFFYDIITRGEHCIEIFFI